MYKQENRRFFQKIIESNKVIQAEYAILDNPDTAFIEMVQASGLSQIAKIQCVSKTF